MVRKADKDLKRARVNPAGEQCNAKKRGKDEYCQQPAGFGTQHPGVGRCKYHGGTSENHNKNAEKLVVMKRMEQAQRTYGIAKDIGPHEALLEEVQRTAGHVQWLQEKIQSFNSDDLTQYTGKDGMKESEWIVMYQNERKMLVQVCNTAIRCGIAERTVKIAEEQGKLIAGMMLKLINDNTLALTPEQRVHAPKIVRNLLLEISSSDTDSSQTRQVGNAGEAITIDPIEDDREAERAHQR